MGWIEFESLWFSCPEGADVFVGCEPFESSESTCEVVGIHEVGEMFPEVFVGFVVEALDGGFLEGSVHALDLAVGPRVLGLGQAVIDVSLGAGELEGMSAEEFPRWSASLISAAAEQRLPGVVKWTPLSVSTVWIL